MRSAAKPLDPLKRQFLYLASELNRGFPDLDLHFNLQAGTRRFRFFAAAIQSDIFEFNLGNGQVNDLLVEATFLLKQITCRYDA
jgi:hypothetical protein